MRLIFFFELPKEWQEWWQENKGKFVKSKTTPSILLEVKKEIL
jgi:hypothetical protein